MVIDKISLKNIQNAQKIITPFIRKTPVLHATRQKKSFKDNPHLVFKLENLQVTGSFKVRGALHKLLSLPQEEQLKPLIAASGGNHGLAVAYAGYTHKLPTTIYLPEKTAPFKIQKIKDWGAGVILAGRDINETIKAAQSTALSENATYIHPFADPDVILGQGTLGIEIMEQLPNIDVLILAIGGGGMIAGVATAAKAIKPNLKIIGVEPETYPTLYKSVKIGKVSLLDKVPTIAVTLAIRETTPLNLQIVQEHVDEIVLVTEEEMRKGCQWLWNEFSVAAEFSGAAALSAILAGKIKLFPEQKTCVIICGAGFDGIARE